MGEKKTSQREETSWMFPRDFWIANIMELCERAAYYGFFIVLTIYLTDAVGFSDKETGWVAGIFYAGVYLLPPFVGAISDRIGFKNGLILAFGLLSVGYFLLAVFIFKLAVILSLTVVMVGAAFVKPVITGTVAKTTTESNRARGFSLFYWVVNIGAFGGKTIVSDIRLEMGVVYINFFSSFMAFIAMLFAIFVFKQVGSSHESKTVKEVARAIRKVFSSKRLVALTLIVAGFWTIQGQLYATMPKYVIRLLGVQSRPEWLANVNPAVVVIFVVFVTQAMRKRTAVTSMLIGMAIMPFSALAMSFSQSLETITGNTVSILGFFAMHPLTVMMIVGIGLQGLAECFISPRFLEYFSLHAPKGEEGLYLGFSHLHSCISAIVGFVMSGYLLDAYCPDPKTLPAGLTEIQRAAYYTDAHYIWYYFTAIGFCAAVALLVFRFVTQESDQTEQ
ncbi:MAG: peptide MFS transporter [Proteobacteria bacterium]|nr:peptide MFS transporter [Pseudomonadota bacterium]